MPDMHGNQTLGEFLHGRRPPAQPGGMVDEVIADAEAAGAYDRAVYDVTVERLGALGISETSDVVGPLTGRDAVEAVVRRHVSLLGPLDRAEFVIRRHHASEEAPDA